MIATDHLLHYEDPATGELVEICEEVGVDTRRIDLLTGDINLTISMWIRGRKKFFDIERGEFANGLPKKFRSQGLTLSANRETVEAVIDHILDTDKLAPEAYYHKQLGFREVDGSVVFLADTPIGPLDPPKDNSHYVNPAVTAPQGTLSQWLFLVKNEVIGHANLELALSIGLSAPVAFLLREEKLFAEVPIWAVIGPSSTGKTTVLRLMSSIYGSPEESTGLIKDLNSTEAAFYRSLSDSTGFPLIVDEATCKTNWDFSTAVYNLSKGMDRARCKTSGELRERLSFSGAIVISGEDSLFDQSTSTLGTHARLVELTLPWTEDGNHARRISQGFRQHYGTAVYPFVSFLLTLYKEHPDILAKLFCHELEELKTLAGTLSNVDERLFNMYATVTTAAIIAKQALKLPLHVKKLRKLLVKQHQQTADQRDPAEKLYEAVKDAVSRNGKYFPKTSGSGKSPLLPSDLWGEFSSRNGDSVLWVTQSTFNEFAVKAGFGNYKQLLAPLCQKGLMVSFGNRHYTTGHRLGSLSVRCYCLKMAPPTKPKPIPKPAKKLAITKSPTRPDLLRDSDDE